MLRNLLVTTATVALMTSSALAAETDAKMEETDKSAAAAGVQFQADESQFLASDLLGTSVYAGPGEEAEHIGEVSNIILNPEGNVAAIVVDVGGFLGMGEKPVALSFEQAEWSESDGVARITLSVDRETLEQSEAFDPAMLTAETKEGGASDAMKTDEQASAEEETGKDTARLENGQAETDATADVEERMAAEEPVEKDASAEEQAASDESMTADEEVAEGETPSLRDRLTLADQANLKAEDIIGATVYGSNDDNIGEVDDIVLSDKEAIEAYIVNIGGFLGLGEKPVAISASDFEIMTDENGSLYIFTPFTEEQLDDHPAYDETAYQEDRDSSTLYREKQ